MLKFLKRLVGVQDPEPEPRPKRRRTTSARSRFDTAPGALPTVTEGNDKTDWALWEDSVAAIDSQLSSLSPRDHRFHSQFMETQPTDLADLDPFGRVTKNRDA